MNIDKEVEKYQKKKEKLLNTLIVRITSFSNEKLTAIKNINKTVDDLTVQREEHQRDVHKAKEQITALKGTK